MAISFSTPFLLEVSAGFAVGLAVGLAVTFALLAEELFSFSRVLGPTVPSAVRLFRRWNSSTASSVASP